MPGDTLFALGALALVVFVVRLGRRGGATSLKKPHARPSLEPADTTV